jgi:hypothetical protein
MYIKLHNITNSHLEAFRVFVNFINFNRKKYDYIDMTVTTHLANSDISEYETKISNYEDLKVILNHPP